MLAPLPLISWVSLLLCKENRSGGGGVFTLTSLSSLSPEATTLSKRVDKVQVPVRYCMLGSRDSARSVVPAALVLASLVTLVGLVTEARI